MLLFSFWMYCTKKAISSLGSQFLYAYLLLLDSKLLASSCLIFILLLVVMYPLIVLALVEFSLLKFRILTLPLHLEETGKDGDEIWETHYLLWPPAPHKKKVSSTFYVAIFRFLYMIAITVLDFLTTCNSSCKLCFTSQLILSSI